MATLEEKAALLEIEAHRGQFRKDGVTPYTEHTTGVRNLLWGIGIRDEDILCAARLHDSIEDSNERVTRELLEREFNPNIARIVAALTRDVDREEYKRRIANADYAVQIIKVADVVHNCSTLQGCFSEKTIRHKVEDCEALYFDLARRICPAFYDMLRKSMAQYLSS